MPRSDSVAFLDEGSFVLVDCLLLQLMSGLSMMIIVDFSTLNEVQFRSESEFRSLFQATQRNPTVSKHVPLLSCF